MACAEWSVKCSGGCSVECSVGCSFGCSVECSVGCQYCVFPSLKSRNFVLPFFWKSGSKYASKDFSEIVPILRLLTLRIKTLDKLY